MPVPGTKAGAIVSAGLVIIAWLSIPGAHIFILGTVGVGALVGLGLSWWYSRE
jgi:TM2 domain-containing membrane protein YozV